MPAPSDLITPKAAARVARVSVATIYRMLADGRLRAWRGASNRRMVRKGDVEGITMEAKSPSREGTLSVPPR